MKWMNHTARKPRTRLRINSIVSTPVSNRATEVLARSDLSGLSARLIDDQIIDIPFSLATTAAQLLEVVLIDLQVMWWPRHRSLGKDTIYSTEQNRDAADFNIG